MDGPKINEIKKQSRRRKILKIHNTIQEGVGICLRPVPIFSFPHFYGWGVEIGLRWLGAQGLYSFILKSQIIAPFSSFQNEFNHLSIPNI